MKPYRGQFETECTIKGEGCLRNLRKGVQPGCMDCHKAITRIVDLDGKVLFEYRSPEERTGERISKIKTKKTVVEATDDEAKTERS